MVVQWDRGEVGACIDLGVPDWTMAEADESEHLTAGEVALYVLVDPFTNDVRYAGQTRQSLENRLNGHIAQALRDVGKHADADPAKTAWICSLLAQQKRPLIRSVGYGPADDANSFERWLIADLWRRGADLLNINHTPRSWCGGTSAETCSYGDRHPVTCYLSHEDYIALRLEVPWGDGSEDVAQMVKGWLLDHVYQRDEYDDRLHLEATSLRTGSLHISVWQAAIDTALTLGIGVNELMTNILMQWLTGHYRHQEETGACHQQDDSQ